MKASLLFLLCIAGVADAAEPLRCNPDGNQGEMNACAADLAKAADAELNAVYGDVLACSKGNPVFVGHLRKAQRAWIVFRDRELDARFPVGSGKNERVLYGSMFPMQWLGEKSRLTTDRTNQLRAYIEDADRNLYCNPSLLKEPGKYHVEDR